MHSLSLALWAASWLTTQTFPPEIPLTRTTLVRQALTANPGVQEAEQTLDTLRARRQKETAWENPMLSAAMAPASVVGAAPFGYELRVEQAFPTVGKLDQKERQLSAELGMAEAELRQKRLQLAFQATQLWAQWYVTQESLETNQQHREWMREFQKAAQAQYAAGKLTQQAPLQAEIEIVMLEEERVMLETRRAVVLANINALLHRESRSFLPSAEAPKSQIISDTSIDSLKKKAISQHPEYAALRAKLAASLAEQKLSDIELWPATKLMASYNSMWAMPEHRFMLGVSLDIPTPWSAQHFAQKETASEYRKVQIELTRVEDAVCLEVETAYVEWQEALQLLKLHEENLLPPTKDRLASARAGFSTGQTTFQEWIEAERALRNVQLKIHQAQASLETRTAMLEYATGTLSDVAEGNAP